MSNNSKDLFSRGLRRVAHNIGFSTAAILAGAIIFANLVSAQSRNKETGQSGSDQIAHRVRLELVTLPYYGVFDNLSYRVDGSTVTLFGQATRPVLKNDAEKAVKNIEGVTRVINNIQVLPPSSMDDRIRLATYRAIYGDSTLSRYAIQAVPPIHIIVNNGHVTLEGVVATQQDRNTAGVRANAVPGVFSVENNLRVEAQG